MKRKPNLKAKFETGAAPFLLALFMTLPCSAGALDLRNAVIVTAPDAAPREQQAVRMLIEEAEKRTGIRWPETNGWPGSGVAVIAVGDLSTLRQFAGPYSKELLAVRKPAGPEGYRLCVKRGAASPGVFVLGDDERGVLFGVGRLLRELHMKRDDANLADELDITTAPKYALRGHQLGYRPKTHSYDAWELPIWEQYLRDLAVFGCNTIELIPPRSDDDADSPHFPRPPMEMMIGMSRLADSYGLGVWIWYPAMDRDYSDSETVERALGEWSEVFSKLPRIDAVFVPGGDPGHTQPKYLMALLEKQTASLHRFHPKAQMWVSPQGFTQEWLDEFLEILRRDQPAWLSGVVHGPQVRVSPARLRELVPARYPIRLYPDITHSRQCQYPVTQWDVAYSITEGREGINPRPMDHAVIARRTLSNSIGFITYSEGCNDDVNKCIWSSLGWNPEADAKELLREYSRYFIGEALGDRFAEGLFALESNWRGPLRQNEGVDKTLEHFQRIESSVSPALLKNWRLQQALYRAYYDAYVRQRLIHETEQEQRAIAALEAAASLKSELAMVEAQNILRQTVPDPAIEARRVRVFQLAEALFQSISMQLSVPLYRAIGVERGANLDSIDQPLNNRRWLEARFAEIGRLGSEAAKLRAIDEIVHWTDPGPGGFYDDLGNVGAQPHLSPGLGFTNDPDCFQTPRINFTDGGSEPRRVSWKDHAEALYDSPLELRYTNLDPRAHYHVRVLYAGDSTNRKIQLTANDTIEIHPLRLKPVPFKPLEFRIPPAATQSGQLKLTWRAEPGLGGNGRACQVSEVWLIKELPAAKSNKE